MPSTRLAGLVIAGGRSQRFGSEKAMACLGSRLLVEWAFSALKEVTFLVGINAPADSEVAAYAKDRQLPLISDGLPARHGPLGGISAGITWARAVGATGLMTLPCDVPFVNPHQLRRLISAGEAAYIETPRGAESLCAVWPVGTEDAIQSHLKQAVYPSLRDVLHSIDATAVHCNSDVEFLNINTREDLANATARLSDLPHQ